MRSNPAVPLLPVIVAVALLAPVASGAIVATVNLGTAGAFAVLAGAGITNTGATTVAGDVGSHPTPAQTGFGPGADSVALTGTNHHDDAVTEGAKADLVTAYDNAAGRPGATPVIGGELGGLTLGPGVYADDNGPDSLAITGTLTLDGEGNAASVFIFQSGSTLVTASASDVLLINGASACNVFWQVGSSATLGTGSHLVGSILALTSITLGNTATVTGRVLARDGAVTMDTNTIGVPTCSGTPPPTPPPPSSPPPSSPPPTSPPPTSPPPTSPPPTSPPPTSPPPTSPPPTTPPSTTPPPTTPPPVPIPFFPSAPAFLAGLGAMAGAFIVLRRRH